MSCTWKGVGAWNRNSSDDRWMPRRIYGWITCGSSLRWIRSRHAGRVGRAIPAWPLRRLHSGRFGLGSLHARAVDRVGQRVNRGARVDHARRFTQFRTWRLWQNAPGRRAADRIDRLERQNSTSRFVATCNGRSGADAADADWRNAKPDAARALATGERSISANLPPLDGANRFRDLKPGEQVLAESDSDRRCWSPRTMVAVACWPLPAIPPGIGGCTALISWPEKIRCQAVLWLARKDQSTDSTVWVTLDKRRYSAGKRVEFSASQRA